MRGMYEKGDHIHRRQPSLNNHFVYGCTRFTFWGNGHLPPPSAHITALGEYVWQNKTWGKCPAPVPALARL